MTADICIINFHGIGTPHEHVDAGEARYWICADRFRRILDQIKHHQAKGRRVQITFDDGNRSDLEIAVPELRARALIGHFFVLTGRCNDPSYLSQDEIRHLSSSEMFVGLHGQDHLDWRRVDADTLDIETHFARKTLEGITCQTIDSVAIPFGGYNRRVIKTLKTANFTAIYTSDGGFASDQSRIRHRTSVQNAHSDTFVDAVLAGQESLLDRVKRNVKAKIKEYAL